MTRIALACALAGSLIAPAAQAAEPAPLCKALKGLAEAARSSGEPLRMRISATGEAACDHEANPARQAFCRAAAEPAGPRPFPWPLKSCVNTMAADPQLFTGPNDRLDRITAKLGGGVRLDVSAAGGGYDVVVWKVR